MKSLIVLSFFVITSQVFADPALTPAPFSTAPVLNCTYVKTENRTVNLTRFQPNGERCQDTGCLPKEIYICLASIACKGHPVYQTTCKSSASGCPSVEECVADDSVTTAQERETIEKMKRSSGTTPQ